MGILAIIVAVVAIITALSLKERVVKLEQGVKNLQSAKGENFTVQTQQAQQVQEKITNENNKEYPEELVSFIKKQMGAGVVEADISASLTGNGWKETDVSGAILYVTGGSTAKAHTESLVDSSVSISPQKNAFTEWLKDDWLMKLGAFLFIIGIGWFVTYAFMNNWIGPVGRITLGLLAGVAVMAVGVWRMRSFKNQGAVLIALGGAIVVITTIAGREMYGFFTPVSSLGIIFLTTVFAAFASVKYESRALAALSMVLGYFAPSLAGGIDGDMASFVYLFVVSSAILWVAAFTGWRFLATTSLGFVAWLSFVGGAPDNIWILFAFVALYFATNVAAVVKSGKTNQADVVTAAGLSILLVSWILAASLPVWHSLLTVGWAALFVLAAFIVFQITKNKELVFIYSGIAVALLGVATAMELSGTALTLAYTFEIAALVFATLFVTGGVKQAQKVSALFILPGVLSIESFISSAWNSGFLNRDFFVLLSFSAVFLVLGFLMIKMIKKENSEYVKQRDVAVTILVVGALYALALLWLSLHAVYGRDVATTVALVIYTLLGIGAYVKGKFGEIKALYISGSVLLGFVVVRLLLIEAWRLDMSGKIVVFLLVGALLVGTAFIGRSHKK